MVAVLVLESRPVKTRTMRAETMGTEFECTHQLRYGLRATKVPLQAATGQPLTTIAGFAPNCSNSCSFNCASSHADTGSNTSPISCGRGIAPRSLAFPSQDIMRHGGREFLAKLASTESLSQRRSQARLAG